MKSKFIGETPTSAVSSSPANSNPGQCSKAGYSAEAGGLRPGTIKSGPSSSRIGREDMAAHGSPRGQGLILLDALLAKITEALDPSTGAVSPTALTRGQRGGSTKRVAGARKPPCREGGGNQARRSDEREVVSSHEENHDKGGDDDGAVGTASSHGPDTNAGIDPEGEAQSSSGDPQAEEAYWDADWDDESTKVGDSDDASTKVDDRDDASTTVDDRDQGDDITTEPMTRPDDTPSSRLLGAGKVLCCTHCLEAHPLARLVFSSTSYVCAGCSQRRKDGREKVGRERLRKFNEKLEGAGEKICDNCRGVFSTDEFRGDGRQADSVLCKMCRGGGYRLKEIVLLQKSSDPAHERLCTTGYHIRPIGDFEDDGKVYKTCSACRKKYRHYYSNSRKKKEEKEEKEEEEEGGRDELSNSGHDDNGDGNGSDEVHGEAFATSEKNQESHGPGDTASESSNAEVSRDGDARQAAPNTCGGSKRRRLSLPTPGAAEPQGGRTKKPRRSREVSSFGTADGGAEAVTLAPPAKAAEMRLRGGCDDRGGGEPAPYEPAPRIRTRRNLRKSSRATAAAAAAAALQTPSLLSATDINGAGYQLPTPAPSPTPGTTTAASDGPSPQPVDRIPTPEPARATDTYLEETGRVTPPPSSIISPGQHGHEHGLVDSNRLLLRLHRLLEQALRDPALQARFRESLAGGGGGGGRRRRRSDGSVGNDASQGDDDDGGSGSGSGGGMNETARPCAHDKDVDMEF